MLDIESNICANTLADACCALEADEQAMLIAGGTDVLIRIREGKHTGAHLVSIGAIPELRGVSLYPNGDIRIGPLTTFRELEENPILQQHLPILSEAASTVGGPQIRAAGTIGGNVCNGVTSADTASTLFALNARLTARSSNNERYYSIHEHYLGPGKVALSHTEILTSITIAKADYYAYIGKYRKYSMRDAMDIATLGCALWMRLDTERTHIADIRIACGVAAPIPMRARKTEAILTGMPISDALVEGPKALREEIIPRDSWRASKAFRLHIAGEVLAETMKAVSSREGIQC